MDLPRIAVLDDYQHVARELGDWTPLNGRAEITVFHDTIADIDALAARLADFEIVCAMRERTKFPRALLARLPRLKLIASTGARNVAIDMEAAAELGIAIAHTGGSGQGTAELTWGLLLAAARHLPAELASVRAGGWQTHVGEDLLGRTLGIVGLGKLGTTVARIGQAFGMETIAWSPNLDRDRASGLGVQPVAKDELFSGADFITIHMVLSERSRGLIGRDDLQRMRPDAWLINTSRGPLVDEAALIETLAANRIAGAALDVFDEEPLPAGHPFRRLPNVLATPHLGYVTADSYRAFYRETIANILAWLDTSHSA